MGDAVAEELRPARSRLREYWPLAAIVLVACLISVVVHTQIFPAYSWNRDEPVYLWQVHALEAGRIFTSGGGTPLFFQPWLSGIRDGMYFSQYTLGWPLVLLVADTLFGTAAAAIVFGTALAVVGTYALARELTRDRTIALVAAAALTVSPVLVVQSGLYLGYLFSLGLGTLFGASLLAGLRMSRRWLLVLSGALVGWLFMTRPYDAFLWAVAFGAYGAFAYWRERRTLLRGAAWAAVGFLPLLVATLAYNRYVTGSFTQFPITAADARDTFGFGTRSIGSRWPTEDFTPKVALKGVGRNGVELPPFLLGSYLGVGVAAVGYWIRRRERSTYALLAIGVAFPVGYFFFWGIHLSAHFAFVSGPLYLIPLFPPLCILIAIALTAAWRRRPPLAVALCAVLVVATIPWMVDRLDKNHAISEAQVPWQVAERSIHGRSLVFLEDSGPYLLHLDPFSENAPDLDGRILYATDRGAQNLDLIASRPGRRVYFMRTNLTTEQTLDDFDLPVPTITVTPMRVERAPSFDLRVHVTNTTDNPVVVAYLQVGPRVEQRTLSTTAAKGDQFETTWRVVQPGSASAGSGTVPLDAPRRQFVVGAGSGTTPEDALRPRNEQQQFSYRFDGPTIELLTPARRYTAVIDRNGVTLTRVSSLPSLAVSAVPVPTT
ncbi:MAG TPA: hypothetical protein VEP49_16395 [Acidimicrobiia bacterium]|nr:hypothetical protein [Acidimicrobiia bacterium]